MKISKRDYYIGIMVSFRPSLRHQIPNIFQLLLLLIGAIIVLYYAFVQKQFPMLGLLVCGFWILILGSFAIGSLRKLRSTYISLDEQYFRTRIGDDLINLEWNDIVMVRRVKDFVEFATNSNRHIIPLKYLDAHKVWTVIQEFAPTAVLDSDAYLRVHSYQQEISEFKSLLQDENIALKGGYPRSTKIGRWLLFIFMFSSSITLFFNDNIWLLSLICFGPMLLIFAALAFQSLRTLEITAKTVCVHNGIWKRTIQWEGIERIKADYLYERFIFYGNDKTIIAPGLKVWIEKNKKLDLMIRAKIWKHQIEIEDNNGHQPAFLLSNPPLSDTNLKPI